MVSAVRVNISCKRDKYKLMANVPGSLEKEALWKLRFIIWMKSRIHILSRLAYSN